MVANWTTDYEAFWGGLFISPDSRVGTSVGNSILWGNSVGGLVGMTAYQINYSPMPTYSIVEGGLAVGFGNTSTDPQFVNDTGFLGDPLLADYSLLPTSPAVDSGSNALLAIGNPRDLQETRRRFDELTVADTGFGIAPLVDRGALEYSETIGRYYC